MTATPATAARRPSGSATKPRPFGASLLRAARQPDSSGLVGLAALLLFVVPDRYGAGPTGFSLSTTTFLGCIGLIVWVALLLVPRSTAGDFNPMRVAVLIYLATALVSAAAAYRRPLVAIETSGVVRALLITIGSVGLALVTCDAIRGRVGVRRVVSLLLYGGYLSALVAVGQKLYGFGYNGYWNNVLGLHTASDLIQTGTLLSGRAVGTGSHPIEFSVACAGLFALAVNQSRFAETASLVLLHRAGAALLAVGCVLGVSRAGFIGLLIALALTVVHLPSRQQINALAAGVVVAIIVQFAGQGTLSTLRYQLRHIGTDSSSRGRTADYGPVFDLVRSHLWTGIGSGTYNPVQNRFLDNAWLGSLLGGGILGVAVLAGTILSALYMAGALRREVADPYLAGVAQAIGVMVLVLGVCAYFFDELSFPQTTTMLFLGIGLLGAIRRISRTYSPKTALRTPQRMPTAVDG